MQAVETGMHLGPKLESTLPVWRLANNEYEPCLPIKLSRVLGRYFSDWNRGILFAGVQQHHIFLPRLICTGIFRTLTLAGIIHDGEVL